MPSIGKANLETVIIHGGGEVVNTFRWGLEQRREIDALEFTRGGWELQWGLEQHGAARELCEAGARGAR
jgi:hypothetical protein